MCIHTYKPRDNLIHLMWPEVKRVKAVADFDTMCALEDLGSRQMVSTADEDVTCPVTNICPMILILYNISTVPENPYCPE
ncbi:hypothetical protein TNCV_57991 [Trichonephila clavipes]|nr:hypothetical protein TNCV_57991 [Trichonephila clavipes]